MTLVLVWRTNGGAIHVASDSRLSYGGFVRHDEAVKILDADMEVEAVGTSSPPIRARLGFATVGRFAVTQSTVANVSLGLRRLQAGPWVTPLDLALVVEEVRRTMEAMGRTIGLVLPESSEGKLVVIGCCAATGKPRAFVVEAGVVGTVYQVTARELLLATNLEALGSGARCVNLADLAAFDGASPLLLMKFVILSGADVGVGGLIQYGVCRPGQEFEVRPLQEYEVDHGARRLRVGFASAGAWFDPLLPSGLVRRGIALAPFTTVIESLIDDGYTDTD